ncbi:MAG: transposase [Marinobacterium sp.]|nr:transposase [Marinobacterium sp.]
MEQDERCRLLKTVTGIGDMVASQTVTEVGNAEAFSGGRDMAAWLGLVLRQYSTGGTPRLLGISKRGNKRLRTLYVHGARAIMSRLSCGKGPSYSWLRKLRASLPAGLRIH